MHLTTDYVALYIVIVVFILLLILRRLPSIDGFERFLHALDSRGGNIAILVSITFWSSVQALKMFWHLIYLTQTNMIKGNEGVINVAQTFVVSNLATVFIGALIKTLTGNNELAQPINSPPSTLTSKVPLIPASGSGSTITNGTTTIAPQDPATPPTGTV